MSDEKYEIIEASIIEWGLIYKGDESRSPPGCRTWYKSQFEKKPDLEHPLVKEAIANHEHFLEDIKREADE
jgi:hypothetical protein